jgi:hypothetical protein
MKSDACACGDVCKGLIIRELVKKGKQEQSVTVAQKLSLSLTIL